jgi:hypothetical protein
MPVVGLVKTEANPTFSKDVFKLFVPKFGEWMDGDIGTKEYVKSQLSSSIDVSSETKLTFTNLGNARNKKVMTIDSNDDTVLNKKNNTYIYRSGYKEKSEISITNNNILDIDVTIDYYLNDEYLFGEVHIIPASSTETVEIEKDISNDEIGSILTVRVSADYQVTINSFDKEESTNFVAAYGDADILYEKFIDISNSKILRKVWNEDWEYAMALCTAHYLDMINRETQKDFGLDEIAKNSGSKGIVEQVKTSKTMTKIKYELVTNNDEISKFWNSTEFGRILITLLRSKAVLTMIVAN